MVPVAEVAKTLNMSGLFPSNFARELLSSAKRSTILFSIDKYLTMHHLLPQDLNDALDDISPARLSNYVSFFSPATPAEIYGLYCWNDALSSRIMRLTGIIEIILRNRFHVALSRQYWDPTQSRGNVDSNDWYLKLYKPYAPNLSTGDRKIREKLGDYANQASPPKVISGMTFGFWPRVLDAQKTSGCTAAGGSVPRVRVPWDTLIPQIVPGHHQQASTFWNVKAHQDALFARIDLVGSLRNRVAHFEPLWKFPAELEEKRERHGIKPVEVTAVPANVDQMIDRLRRSYRRTTQLLLWLSKSRAAAYDHSENHQALSWLMSKAALDHFRALPPHREVRLSSLARKWELKSELRAGGFVLVTDKGDRVGRYYSGPG